MTQDLNSLSHAIIGAAIEVHQGIGPGLLESAYRKCLAKVLRDKGFQVQEEVILPLRFQGVVIDENAYRIDLIVNDLIIVEVKAVETMKPLFSRQTLTYLKLTGRQLGLLINFNVGILKEGIIRVVNNFEE
ncbi:MAG: GxxExxY protein [Kiritimatiellales bacterium]